MPEWSSDPRVDTTRRALRKRPERSPHPLSGPGAFSANTPPRPSPATPKARPMGLSAAAAELVTLDRIQRPERRIPVSFSRLYHHVHAITFIIDIYIHYDIDVICSGTIPR